MYARFSTQATKTLSPAGSFPGSANLPIGELREPPGERANREIGAPGASCTSPDGDPLSLTGSYDMQGLLPAIVADDNDVTGRNFIDGLNAYREKWAKAFEPIGRRPQNYNSDPAIR